jgi:glutamate mutase epsilon subunit
VSGCNHPPADGMRVADSDLDAFEVGLLAVLRHFCTSFCAPQSKAWMNAYGIATERWGISAGPKAAQSLLTAAEAMRRSRPTVFVFSSPTCLICREHITPNERQFMQVIHAARRGDVGVAQTAAMMLCEGGDTLPFVQAAIAMAGLFPATDVSGGPRDLTFAGLSGVQIH